MRRRDDTNKDPPGDVVRAYAPYLIIIAVFSIAQIPAVKDALAEKPWTTTVPVARPRRGEPGRRGAQLADVTTSTGCPRPARCC